jgi:hypothetical protein
MGSARPARRSTPSGLTWRGVPSRLSPDGGPPCAFAPLQRSIAAPPHRPADPKAAVGRCFLSWAFVPYDTCGTADPYPRGFRPRGVPRPGFGYPHRGVHHRPSLALRRGASGLHPPRRSPRSDRDRLRDPLPSWRSPRRFASLPGERADAVAFRASIPLRARSAVPGPERPGAPMPSWAFSLQSAFLRPSRPLWSRGAIPPHALGGFDVRPTCVSRSCGAEDLTTPLGAAGSRGVRHRSPSRAA